MKNVLKLFSSVAMLAIVASFSSCGDLIRDAYVGNNTGNELTICVDDYNGARTVLPTEFNASSTLYYQLTGESNNGSSVSMKVNFVSGSAKVTLDSYSWDLTLTAYKNYNEETKAFSNPVLRGTTTVDMRYVSTPVSFTLYPWTSKENGVKGNVVLGGTSSGSELSSLTKYEIALYDWTTGVVVPETNYSYEYTDEDTKGSFSYEKVVPSGEYYAKVVVYAGDKPLGSWTDLVIVDPGTDSTKNNIAIVLAEKPEAPTGFKATYVEGSDTSSLTYNVKLDWNRTALADDYIVYLQEKDAEGNNISSPIEFSRDTNYTNSPFYKEGSLLLAKDGLTLKLIHGHIYEATIKSRNVVGESATASACTYYMDDSNLETETTSGYISRFAITYNLNGGVWLTAKNAGSKATKYEYHKFTTDSVTLLAPEDFVGFDNEDPGQEYPVLVKGSDNSKFLEWHNMNGTVDSGKVTTVSGTQNITVKALYKNSETEVSIVFANRKDIDTSRMTVVNSSTNSSVGGSLVLENNVDIEITFDGTVKSSYSDENEFESYRAVLICGRTGEIISQSTQVTQGQTVSFNTLDVIEEGNYELLISARKKGTSEEYSITKFFVITRTK